MSDFDRRTIVAGLGMITAGGLSAPALAQSRDVDVIILGAGLSGLASAHALERAGLSVQVIEASNRIGGRLQTLHDLPGSPNAGGVQIGGSYRRTKALCDGFGVPLVEIDTIRRETLHLIGGTPVRQADWATSAANPFPPDNRALTPSSALMALAAPANPLADAMAWRGAGASDLSADAFLRATGLSDEARRLVDVGLNANNLSSYAMINVWRTLKVFEADRLAGPMVKIEGGSQRLPAAMAATTRRRVMMGDPVVALQVDGHHVRARLQSGRDISAHHCICTLPLPALRRVRIDAALLPLQREAIRRAAYTQIIQLHFAPEVRFWDEDGLPPDMWTDSPLERIFANRDSSGAPDGLMLAWINGDGCNQWAGLSDVQVEARLSAELSALRPASQGRSRLLRVIRWTAQNPWAGGAYIHFAPGQAAAWAATLGQSARHLHFAGEHLSVTATGIEGALESAEAAVAAILAG